MVTDNFTGAAGALSSPWTRFEGQMPERDGSGACRHSSTPGSDAARYVSSVSSLDQYVQIKYVTGDGAGHYWWGILRASGADGTRNNLQFAIGKFDSTCYFTRVTNGSGVDFATHGLGSLPADGDIWKLEIDANGTNPVLKGYRNGTQLGADRTYTGTLNQVGEAGVGLYHGAGSSSFRVDDFEAGDIGGGTPVDLGVPFLAESGVEYAPGVVEADVISVPFLTEAGVEYAPTIDVTIVPLIVPFLSESGVEYAPGIREAEVLVVPFLSEDGSEYAPTVAITTVPIQVGLLLDSGEEWAPAIDPGVAEGVLAIPFLPESGDEYALTIDVAQNVLTVPFVGALGSDYAPGIEVTPVVLSVPFVPASGLDYAPSIVNPLAITSLILELRASAVQVLELRSSITEYL